MKCFSLWIGLALLSGCVCLDQRYVEADAATLRAVGPEYEGYVLGDPDLTREQRERRLRTLRAWRDRVGAGRRADEGGGPDGQ